MSDDRQLDPRALAADVRRDADKSGDPADSSSGDADDALALARRVLRRL